MIKNLNLITKNDSIFNILPLLGNVEILRNDYNSNKEKDEKIEIEEFENDYNANESNSFYYTIHNNIFEIDINKNILKLSIQPNREISISDLQSIINSLDSEITISLDGDNDFDYDIVNNIIDMFSKEIGIYIIMKLKNILNISI